MKSELVNCKKCGLECFWDTNRHGKKYLAVKMVQEYAGGTGTWKQPHFCTATPEQAAEYQALLKLQIDEEAKIKAEALANGEIVVGQTVKVYRGRKVPQGTIGVVFWLAEEADDFGTYKVGIKSADGTRHFVAINNVDFYFDGADELNATRVAKEKAEAKARREAMKAFIESGEELEI